MKKSLKEIIDTFETYGKRHKVIKDVQTKPLTQFTANNYLYPLMWIQLTSAGFETGQAKIKLSIYFVDKLTSDYKNFIQVISNTLKLCEDTLSYFYEYEEINGFYVSNDSDIIPVEYAFDDNVAGNKMDLTIQVCDDYNKNEVAI